MMMLQETIEEWRDINGYDNYQVSNLGRVQNTTSGHVMKLFRNNSKYLCVVLSIKGTKTTHKIHRLVAQQFIPNPNNKTTVDHIDNKATENNNVSNLRWATRQEQRRNTSKQQPTSSSQYKGVSWNKKKNNWHSYIKFNGKQKHLGFFKTEEEAALAYNLKATEHFGELKKLNELASIEH
jgi:hypothetical protein